MTWDESGTGDVRGMFNSFLGDGPAGFPPSGRVPFHPYAPCAPPLGAQYGVALMRVFPKTPTRRDYLRAEYAAHQLAARQAASLLTALARLGGSGIEPRGWLLVGVYDLAAGALVAWALYCNGQVARSWGWNI